MGVGIQEADDWPLSISRPLRGLIDHYRYYPGDKSLGY